MFRAYFLIELISYICSIAVFIIIASVIIYYAIRYYKIRHAVNKLRKWVKENKNDSDESEDNRCTCDPEDGMQ